MKNTQQVSQQQQNTQIAKRKQQISKRQGKINLVDCKSYGE